MTPSNYSSSIEWLLAQTEQFLKNNPSITPECFGWWTVRDTKLVDRLRAGGDITTRKMDKIVAFLQDPKPPTQEK